jgi:hypothetical protein
VSVPLHFVYCEYYFTESLKAFEDWRLSADIFFEAGRTQATTNSLCLLFNTVSRGHYFVSLTSVKTTSIF